MLGTQKIGIFVSPACERLKVFVLTKEKSSTFVELKRTTDVFKAYRLAMRSRLGPISSPPHLLLRLSLDRRMKSMRVLPLALAALCCVVLMLDFTDGAVMEKRIDSSHNENRIESVAETEKRLKKLVNAGIKMAFPYLMSTVTEIRLSRNCLQGLLMMVKGVMDIKDWAIKSE
ncbi:nose resistant to fluoxetine protein 6 [Nephila pilipes]|uniref:Nose resistant to fluoxetine protein 6 n=1 Tax=Nephila pilipes TaxID=299642 RepID=A0A8X6MR63_NEPPI|nr:nose resistant to fluoxetine protein 6 [Nephila pilipes]